MFYKAGNVFAMFVWCLWEKLNVNKTYSFNRISSHRIPLRKQLNIDSQKCKIRRKYQQNVCLHNCTAKTNPEMWESSLLVLLWGSSGSSVPQFCSVWRKSSCVIRASHMKAAACVDPEDDATQHTPPSAHGAAGRKTPGWDSFKTDPIKTQRLQRRFCHAALVLEVFYFSSSFLSNCTQKSGGVKLRWFQRGTEMIHVTLFDIVSCKKQDKKRKDFLIFVQLHTVGYLLRWRQISNQSSGKRSMTSHCITSGFKQFSIC